MTEANEQPDKLVDVLQLADAVANRLLEARTMNSSIDPEQFAALVRAARLLQDHEVPWPPLVVQVMQEFAEGLASAKAGTEAEEPTADDDGPVTGLTRFMAAFHREKGVTNEP